MEVERLPGGERLINMARAGVFLLPPLNLHPITSSFLSASSKGKKEEEVDLNFLQDHEYLIKTLDSVRPTPHPCASNTMCHIIPGGSRAVEGSPG